MWSLSRLLPHKVGRGLQHLPFDLRNFYSTDDPRSPEPKNVGGSCGRAGTCTVGLWLLRLIVLVPRTELRACAPWSHISHVAASAKHSRECACLPPPGFPWIKAPPHPVISGPADAKICGRGEGSKACMGPREFKPQSARNRHDSFWRACVLKHRSLVRKGPAARRFSACVDVGNCGNRDRTEPDIRKPHG